MYEVLQEVGNTQTSNGTENHYFEASYKVNKRPHVQFCVSALVAHPRAYTRLPELGQCLATVTAPRD